MRALPGIVLLAVVAITAAGCSSFSRDARAARSAAVVPGSPEGIWEGRWHDAKNPRHGGELQCVLTQTGENLYRISTRAQWWKIFRTGNRSMVVLTPTAPGAYLLQGDEAMWLFGHYSITGRVDSSRLLARYWIGNHEGVVEMTRPEAAAAPAPAP
jgi:hypothetical protein